jgi:hypothetical protein
MPVGLAANQMDRAYNTALKHAKRLGLKFERDRHARLRHKNAGVGPGLNRIRGRSER